MKPASLVKPFFFVALPVTVLILFLIYTGMEVYAHLISSPRFGVREIEVLTDGHADKNEVLRLANIKIGTNIFNLNLKEVQRNVENDPWVESATVSRALPDRIQIRYQQQTPVAILGAESLYYLNKKGVPFYKVRQEDSLEYPFIHLENGAREQDATKERILGALKLLQYLYQSKWAAKKDLGDLTIRESKNELSPPYLLTMHYPLMGIPVKSKPKSGYFTVSFASDDLEQQVKRAEAALRYLGQAGKNPRLIRLELGKKVVVKVE